VVLAIFVGNIANNPPIFSGSIGFYRYLWFFTCHIWNMRDVLVLCGENLYFFIVDFHVLGLFMAKNHNLSEIFPYVTRRAVAVERKICATPTA
jgi:hypothetical protein